MLPLPCISKCFVQGLNNQDGPYTYGYNQIFLQGRENNTGIGGGGNSNIFAQGYKNVIQGEGCFAQGRDNYTRSSSRH